MDSRKIVIVNTKTQRKSVIETAATTLGELKTALKEAGIDYTGMTFYEGISKIELKQDDSVLPHDVPYKGTTTNNLVFMLTNTNKNIKSGADRKQLYADIKNLHLENKVKEIYGKNYTQVSSLELTDVILRYGNNADKASEKAVNEAYTKQEADSKIAAFIAQKANTSSLEDSIMNLRNAVVELTAAVYDIANDADIDSGTYDSVIDNINNAKAFLNKIYKDSGATDSNKKEKKENKVVSPYSDSEIDDIINGMK